MEHRHYVPFNAMTLLSAYQAEILEQKGSTGVTWGSLTLPIEMRSVWSMTSYRVPPGVLAVAGKRAQWLNLSGLSDAQKADMMDAEYEPTKGLFGPALQKIERDQCTLETGE